MDRAPQSTTFTKAETDIHTNVEAGIGHILVCLDRSALSEAAVRHAVALARVFEARLTLLHVMEAPPASTSMPDPLAWELARQEARAYLDAVRERTETLGPKTTTMLVQGSPAERIVSAAAEVEADLTVLASHGETDGRVQELGSTAQQVLALGHGSVFVVGRGPSSRGTPRRILVALDGSTRTECVLPTATRVARSYEAELLLAHVVSEPVPSAILTTGADLEHARDLSRRLEVAAERYLGQVASTLSRDHLAVRSVVLRETDERQALLELCARENVDLIIVSAHGSTCNPIRAFGTVSSYLLSHARAALLVIQDLGADERGTGAIPRARRATPLRGTPHTGPAEKS